jgi:protein TonB
MRTEGWALAGSIFLHGLLVGAMIFMAGFSKPPAKLIHLDFTLLEQYADPLPEAVENTASPLPPPTIKQPTPEPLPAPRPIMKVTAKLPAKKLQSIAKKTLPQVAAVEQNLAPAPQPNIGDSAITVASSADVATAPLANAPTINLVEEYRSANFKTIRDSVLAKLHYPMIARHRGWSGKVDVAFLIAPDGRVSELRIQVSSGFPVLDEQALDAIRSAAPFTPPRIAALLVMPVTFQLN